MQNVHLAHYNVLRNSKDSTVFDSHLKQRWIIAHKIIIPMHSQICSWTLLHFLIFITNIFFQIKMLYYLLLLCKLFVFFTFILLYNFSFVIFLFCWQMSPVCPCGGLCTARCLCGVGVIACSQSVGGAMFCSQFWLIQPT